MSSHGQIEHLFRHEYGQLVALLVRRFGFEHFEQVEDAVQWAMAQALDIWLKQAVPDKPSAWLYQVALRYLLSQFRQQQSHSNLLAQTEEPQTEVLVEPPLSGELSDALLRMLFVASDEALAVESQLVFTLKSLVGFSIKETALRLFISEANVYKRFSRARKHLQQQPLQLDSLNEQDMQRRLPTVYRVLYLLFTEGYLSSHEDLSIRQDLCEEAIRLTGLLSQHALGNRPESHALLALMYLNTARLPARQQAGELLLLQEQDRSSWNQAQIAMGLRCLQRSAQGDQLSRYHIEAGIAAEHCLASSFEQTRWHKIVEAYQLLEKLAPSPFHILNRAVALAQWQGAKVGLAELENSQVPSWLSRSYHWYAVLADLQFRSGEQKLAEQNAQLALEQAPSATIRRLLSKRWRLVAPEDSA
ncbi:DNA-directed RNA polymerase sigma-70 factor [Agarivorans sp. OAG1]|uniref:RNA polymerase sigma factor n=1 Tax=Agarivorans sp. OAG1 TaxID=3082387 RepID=UPI002B2FEDB6|nr:DNA-directed RNA polymerase sigma-70 factor [Agarivorans sp. OAG1]